LDATNKVEFMLGPPKRSTRSRWWKWINGMQLNLLELEDDRISEAPFVRNIAVPEEGYMRAGVKERKL
jgi:hypothetical protein